MGVVVVDSMCDAIVREYLTGRNLKQSLSAFDYERPPSPDTLLNRNMVLKTMRINKIASRFKDSYSVLEVLVDFFLQRAQSRETSDGTTAKADDGGKDAADRIFREQPARDTSPFGDTTGDSRTAPGSAATQPAQSKAPTSSTTAEDPSKSRLPRAGSRGPPAGMSILMATDRPTTASFTARRVPTNTNITTTTTATAGPSAGAIGGNPPFAGAGSDPAFGRDVSSPPLVRPVPAAPSQAAANRRDAVPADQKQLDPAPHRSPSPAAFAANGPPVRSRPTAGASKPSVYDLGPPDSAQPAPPSSSKVKGAGGARQDWLNVDEESQPISAHPQRLNQHSSSLTPPPPQQQRHPPSKTTEPPSSRSSAPPDQRAPALKPGVLPAGASSTSSAFAAATSTGFDSATGIGGARAAAGRPGAARGELAIEDVDDVDGPVRRTNAGGGGEPQFQTYKTPAGVAPSKIAIGTPLGMEDGRDVRKLVFGSPQGDFPPAWRQGFFFCDRDRLRYGLVQLEGGPCGVLAAVQAYIIRELLFSMPSDKQAKTSWSNPSADRRIAALVNAVSEILWQAGDRRSARVAIYSPDPSLGSKIRDERMKVFDFGTKDSLCSFIANKAPALMEKNGLGIIMLLYSAILTRTCSRLKSDMDDPTATLIGAHGYCTQEMVNLLLIGRGYSNVFDGEMKLDGGSGEDTALLRGIPRKSAIGYLTLMEKFNYCKVGRNLKEPSFPVWVICSESHFTVLFSPDPSLTNASAAPKFDLYFYDELANQDDELRLTIDTRGSLAEGGDLTPPLEDCIRTRWPGASVDWNGSDKLL